MESLIKVLTVIAVLTGAASCAHKMPLVSHAHIGHSLDYWHDTPDNIGLYQAANRELQVAIEAADAALDHNLDDARRRALLSDALHALDPTRTPGGRGLGYGALRAWNGAIDHLEFAATSPDASTNIVSGVARLAGIGDHIGLGLTASTERAYSALAAGDDTSEQVALSLRTDLLQLYRGRDANGDGAIAMNTDEAGVMQLVAELHQVLGREVDPSYEPLPRRYVLGLVRLPNGLWGFRMPRTQSAGYGY